MSTAIQPRLVRLTGVIAHYKATRMEASFFFTDSERNAMGVIAIAAAVVGLSGPAIATAANTTNTDEDADYVEFDLNGNSIGGWVWRSPFKEGDKVEVIAEWQDDHYEVAGIARPEDRTIALYPHCSRGFSTHVENSIKWWFFSATLFNIFVLLLALPVVGFHDYLRALHEVVLYGAVASFLLFGLMAFRLSRKFMPFVRLTEKVLTELGWPNPKKIDLVKSTKAQRKPDDPGELGTFYFRY